MNLPWCHYEKTSGNCLVGFEIYRVLAATLRDIKDQVEIMLVRIIHERMISEVGSEFLNIKGVGSGLRAKIIKTINRRSSFGHSGKINRFLSLTNI
jgi:hypothetical protein